MLLAFLRARKYKQPDSFEVLEKFTTSFWFNPKYRHIVEGFDPETLRAYTHGSPSRMLMQSRDRMGNAVGVIYAARMDAAFLGFDDMVRMGLLGFAWLLEHEDVQLQGVSYAETFEGFSLLQAMRMRNALSANQQKELMSLFMGAFPFRIRAVYVVRQPRYFNIVWAIARVFFKKKLVSRVHLLGELHRLHEHVAPEALPPELGGTLVEPPDALIDEIVAAHRARGEFGGFRIPMSVDEPSPPRGVPNAAAAAPPADVRVAEPVAPS